MAIRGRSRRRRTLTDLALAALVIGMAVVAAALLGGGTAFDVGGPARVADGDTIVVAGERVRLRGIDAPEIDQTCMDADGGTRACGRLAARHLDRLIDGRAVRCDGYDSDRFGRLLGVCRVPAVATGVDLNARMVADGWAVSFGDYGSAEAAARAERLGLWAWSFERPQQWRRQRAQATAPADPGIMLRRVRAWLGLGGHLE